MKKTIVCIGGSKGIGAAATKLLLEKEYDIHMYSRSAPETSSSLHHTEFDINNEFPIDTLPENVDGYIYFPGSINLRQFERFSMDDMNDLNINYLANIKILQKIMPKLKKLKMTPRSSSLAQLPFKRACPFMQVSRALKAHWRV